ncbi:IS3 family transposase [Nocardia sp. bgisy118]|uniref:IS3 family transposase n=1 Tax=Nocardia sp. bgisy118 TaxID=3413786 RepID=UPI003F4A1E9E
MAWSTTGPLVLLQVRVATAVTTCRFRHRPPSDRVVADAHLHDALRDLQNCPEAVYGRRKMVHYLRRQGFDVAFCTVDRLMGQLGLTGVVRG